MKPMAAAGVVIDGVAPDGTTALAQTGDGAIVVFDLRDGTSRPTDLPGDTVLSGWTPDSREAFIGRPGLVPQRLERMDLRTGRRTFVREFAPADQSGLLLVVPPKVSSDGRAYAYQYFKRQTTLFVVKGVSP